MQNIQTLESLAMLALPGDERDWAEKTIAGLEPQFQALSDVNTADVEPLVTVLDIKNIMREDVWSKSVSREELLSNAPEQYDGYLQVPRTLE